MFSFGQRLAAAPAIVALSAFAFVGTALPATAATQTELSRAEVTGKIDFRLARLSNLNTSAAKSADVTAAQREGLQLMVADSIANLGELRLDVATATTVDEIEAARRTMTGYRINQVVVPKGTFVIRGMRMSHRMSASAASLRAARSRTNHAADIQLARAAAQLDVVATSLAQSATAAYKVSPRTAIDGATPFTSANSYWATAMTALGRARGYLDAAQKADRRSPADAVIRPAEAKPSTPLFDAP